MQTTKKISFFSVVHLVLAGGMGSVLSVFFKGMGCE